MNRMAVTRIKRQGQTFLCCILLNEKRKFEDFFLVKEEESLLNRIYIGRVEDLAKGIGAAFVSIEKGRKCFLPFDELKSPVFTKKNSPNKPICIGDELLVQVIRDAVKTKEAVASAKLVMQGKCAVLTTDNCALSVSKKLSAAQRKDFEQLFAEIVPPERDFGLIIRTTASSYPMEEVKEDVLSLMDSFRRIKQEAVHREAFQLMYQDPPAYIAKLKTMNLANVDKILTDQQDIFDQIARYSPPAAAKLEQYRDPVISLERLYQIESTIDALCSSKVWLSSGANIIIEQLETLTFIDVNTAKNQSKKESVLLEVNKEAAAEIARQLKLRNISGMILIDFINLKTKEEEQELIRCLKEHLRQDSCPCSFVDITKLGLVELTRKKLQRSLREILN